MKHDALGVIAAAGAIILCLNPVADAQEVGSGATSIATGQNVPGSIALPPGGILPFANDQNEIVTRAWNIVPRVSLTETLSNNINLSSSEKKTGLISSPSAGVRIDGRTARLKVFFDYGLTGNFYSTGTRENSNQSTLNSFGTLEAVDNWMFIDFRAQIYQQLINPFGQQQPSSVYDNRNTAQTSTYGVSPYIRGQLFGTADYLLRYNYSFTDTGTNGFSDINLSQWVGQIRGNTRFENLKWVIDGSQQSTDYSRGRDYDDRRLRALLKYRLLPELEISASGGTESNNYQSLDNEQNNTYGFGFNWRPTERTDVSAFKEERFFGYGHNVLVSHRFPLSTIRYTDVRDVAFIPNQSTTAGLGTIYDVYYEQLANLIPDAATRAEYVRNLLSQAGIAPNAQATSDYLTNRPRVQRLQRLTLVLYGSRNSITLVAGRNDNQALTVVGGDLGQAISDVSRVKQQGFSAGFSHRLTPLTALNLLADRQKTESGEFDVLRTTMTTYQAGVSTRMGAKTVGSLSARYTEFDSPISPYNETAIVGTIAIFF